MTPGGECKDVDQETGDHRQWTLSASVSSLISTTNGLPIFLALLLKKNKHISDQNVQLVDNGLHNEVMFRVE